MHGIRRMKHTPESLAAEQEKERKELQVYLELNKKVLISKSKLDYSKDALLLTTDLLNHNPEFYTIWNYRRNILIKGWLPSLDSESRKSILFEELDFTMAKLRRHPKVYWIWNHRRWCLETIPEGPGRSQDWRKQCWNQELAVVENMLERDPRNFLAWSYRRYVLSSHPDPGTPADELAYTKKKIQSNFSNFSAWHQRAKVFSSAASETDKSGWKDAEFDLIKNAIWTDPSDQSPWIYHRWLVGKSPDLALLHRELSVVRELLEEEPNSKWCLETLTHYLLMLISHPDFHGDPTSTQNERLTYLERLAAVDPLRCQRYKDLMALNPLRKAPGC